MMEQETNVQKFESLSQCENYSIIKISKKHIQFSNAPDKHDKFKTCLINQNYLNFQIAPENNITTVNTPLLKPNQIFSIIRNNSHSHSVQGNSEHSCENTSNKNFINSEQQNLKSQLLKINYNRKEKSLEELSKKFLRIFISYDECLIELDNITHKLGVERRRIYDIINILESLKLVHRKGKNNYKWNGLSRIEQTISMYELKKPKTFIVQKSTEKLEKKEKSLEILSIGFLQLFLHWKEQLSLEEAAKQLSINLDEHKLKTIIRRLYDIANVFKSLGLIKKTILQTKKPGFCWIGLKGIANLFQKLESQSNNKENLNLNQLSVKKFQSENLSLEISKKVKITNDEQQSQDSEEAQDFWKTFMSIANQKKEIFEQKQEESEKEKQEIINLLQIFTESVQQNKNQPTNQNFKQDSLSFVTPITKKTVYYQFNDKENQNSQNIVRNLNQQLQNSNQFVLRDSTNLIQKKSPFEISEKSSFKKIKKNFTYEDQILLSKTYIQPFESEEKINVCIANQ